MMQLHEFRSLPDNACFLSNEESLALSSLISAHSNPPSLFEFKLLEKEKIFPKEHFFLKSNQINAALDSIDSVQREAFVNNELMSGLEKMTLQESLIDERDSTNRNITLKIESEEPKPEDFPMEAESNPGVQRVFYSLENTVFDEEKALAEGRKFVGLEIEEKEMSPLVKACFNKEVMKKKMVNEDSNGSLKKVQQSLSLLSFSNDLE